MKKFIVILLLMMYGASSTGMTIHFHFCCGQLENVDFRPGKKCGMDSGHQMGSQSCCESQMVSLQIEDEQAISKATHNVFPQPTLMPAAPGSLVSASKGIISPEPPIFPPPLLKEEMIHLFCAYRI